MLFKRELKRNFKSFIATCIICVIMAMYMIAISPSLGEDIKQILNIKFPDLMQTAFGFKELDFNSANSFYAISFSYLYLFLCIYISGVFTTIVSKEFSDKTAEYLFTLPAKRIEIIFTKLSVAFIYIVLTITIIFLASWLSFAIYIKENYDIIPVALMALAWLIGGLTFGSIAFLLSSFIARTKSNLSISIGFVLIMYLLQIVIAVNDKLSFLKYISPFDWFKGSEITNSGEISIVYCIIAFSITVISLFFGIRRFNRMDVLI